MNKLQLIASAISGYEPTETSSRNDFYYDDCETEDQKKEQILEYASNVYNINLTDEECNEIYLFLEKEQELQQNERFHLFKKLGRLKYQLITFRIDKDLYNEFKVLVGKEGWNITKLFTNFIKNLVNDR